MPINIYRREGNYPGVASLCEESWNLPVQIDALEKWLQERGARLAKARYVADVGFKIREDAGGGGATLSPEAMKIMADIGMGLYLSEYPGFSGNR